MELNIKFDKSGFTRKAGDYYTGKAVNLADPLLHVRAQEYKRKLSASMKPLAAHDIYNIPKARGYHVMRKYDGEFTFVIFDGKSILSINPGGTARVGLPCFVEAEKLLKKAKVKSCILAAELYVTGDLGGRNRVREVVRKLQAPSSEADLKKIGLAVFDIVEFNGEPVASAAKVFRQLLKWFSKGTLVHPAENITTDKIDRVMEAFTDWVIGENSEGVVLRHDRLGWYKIKLRHNLDVAVIGFSEGAENRKGILHDLLTAVMRNDGTYQELVRVGGGFSEEDRKTIFEDLKKRIVPSDYVAVNNDYVAYEMIEPGMVIEISCLDLIPESSKGDPVKRMTLDWNGERYAALSRMPLVSVISPQFVRIRDDKEANVEDVNIRQVCSLVSIADAEKPAHKTASAPSRLLERTVYTKTMRGNKMVRKLLLWKTNKEEQGEFPDYVVYLTDFSPNRQNLLERDIRIANNERDARKLFSDMASKNFVSGWEKAA